jgi:hypothetical protein
MQSNPENRRGRSLCLPAFIQSISLLPPMSHSLLLSATETDQSYRRTLFIEFIEIRGQPSYRTVQHQSPSPIFEAIIQNRYRLLV